MEDNWGMIGHQWAISLLNGQIESQNTRHAYLITGPSGVGKRTLALNMATRINLPKNASEDENIRYLRQMERMEHVDLAVLKRKDGDKNIKIDAIRTLQKSIHLSPYMAPFRIALILNFEDANPNAANALLKTLEEPPKSTKIFVTASRAEALLPTIVSRCEEIRLRPVSIEEVVKGLVDKWNVPADKANLLAHISGGRVGYALYLHQNPDVLSERDSMLSQHLVLLSSGKVARFQYAQDFAKDRAKFLQLLQVWLSYWRDIMIVSANQNSTIFNLDRKEEIYRLGSQVSTSTSHNTVKLLEKTLNQLHYNVNLRLAAESLLLQMPSL